MKRSYVWSPVYVDAMIARDRDTDGNGSLDERLYAIHDANFNIVGLVDTSGNVVERYAYDAHGSVSYMDGSWGSRSSSSYAWTYGFQGLPLDTAVGLLHARHRDLDPVLGRPLQLDPLGFAAGDVDLYRWEAGSPINLTDPSGLVAGGGVASAMGWREDLERQGRDLLGELGRMLLPPGSSSGSSGSGGSGPVMSANDLMDMYLRMMWDTLRWMFRPPTPQNWPSLGSISNGAAAWADMLTGGMTGQIRDAAGYDDAVDYNSPAYRGGQHIGEVHNMLIVPGGGGPAMGGGRALAGQAAGGAAGRGGMAGQIANAAGPLVRVPGGRPGGGAWGGGPGGGAIGKVGGLPGAPSLGGVVVPGEQRILYHYTSEKGLKGINKSKELRPSTKAANPKDARHGDGQYLSDIVPGTKSPGQLSKAFLNDPRGWSRFTHYVKIDVTGLKVVQGRPGVFVVPNSGNLNLAGRILGGGKVPKPRMPY